MGNKKTNGVDLICDLVSWEERIFERREEFENITNWFNQNGYIEGLQRELKESLPSKRRQILYVWLNDINQKLEVEPSIFSEQFTGNEKYDHKLRYIENKTEAMIKAYYAKGENPTLSVFKPLLIEILSLSDVFTTFESEVEQIDEKTMSQFSYMARHFENSIFREAGQTKVMFDAKEFVELEIKKLEGNVDGDEGQNNLTSKQIIKWLGTPSQFGFLVDLLIQGGYLERPAKSLSKTAKFFLEHFEIKTTLSTLEKELSETTNSLSIENRNKIKIPHKDKLS